MGRKRRHEDIGEIGMHYVTPEQEFMSHLAMEEVSKKATNESLDEARGSGDSNDKEPPAVHLPKRLKKQHYLHSQRKSWFTRIAGLVVYRFASYAERLGIDPRLHPEVIGMPKSPLSTDARTVLSEEDVRLLWRYIAKQYPDASLQSICHELEPYSQFTVDDFIKEEIQAKYKDVIPKPPLTTFMLFYKRKLPKLREKHPDLKVVDLGKKIGKKWKSMSVEKKEKYKQEYIRLKSIYESELEQFYISHPDAKCLHEMKKAHARVPDNSTSVKKQIKELKKLVPKTVGSAYLLYCAAKRDKLHQRHPELKPTEITARLAKKWGKLNEDKKAHYQALYAEKHSAYTKDLEQFYEQHPNARELLKGKRKMPKAKKSVGPQSSSPSEKDVDDETNDKN